MKKMLLGEIACYITANDVTLFSLTLDFSLPKTPRRPCEASAEKGHTNGEVFVLENPTGASGDCFLVVPGEKGRKGEKRREKGKKD